MHKERAGDPDESALLPVEVVTESRALDFRHKDLPAAIQEAGPASGFAYEEFLFGQIRNANTRRAYEAAVKRFLEWLRLRDLGLAKVTPRDVGDYLDSLNLSIPSKKLHRAALNHFFDFQVQRHAVVLNPVSSVRNERYQVAEGKTPEITVKQARRLFASIEASTVVGLRDRAAIAVLAYSGSRIGAVTRLRRQDLVHEGDQWILAFSEKGGKQRKVPVRHDLQRMLFDYLNAAGITELDGDLPILRSSKAKKGTLSTAGMTDNDLQRMFKRRLCGVAGIASLLILGAMNVAQAGLERAIQTAWCADEMRRTTIEPNPDPGRPPLPLEGTIGQFRYPEQLYWVRLVNGKSESGPTRVHGKVRVHVVITGGPPTQKNLTVIFNDEIERRQTFTSGGIAADFDFDLPRPGNCAVFKVLLKSSDWVPLNFKFDVEVREE